ncbi:hypothetical protein QE390_001276 [Siphonobacter sp. SORGH_AS 1065]|nr:hypothetical protein [Siphonobacter sp. SORGH_AS_1065]
MQINDYSLVQYKYTQGLNKFDFIKGTTEEAKTA